VGKGYLAYQFAIASPPVAAHQLYIVRIDSRVGISEPVILELPQFQVHGMLCREGWLEMAAFTGIYRVRLDGNNSPLAFDFTPFAKAGQIPQEFVASQLQNLGQMGGGRAYRSPIRIRLTGNGTGREFFLSITAEALEPISDCRLSVTSRILETDANGNEVTERIVFKGQGFRECGD